MRTLFCLIIVACLQAAASAQSSWDVSIVSATGRMQAFQGRTYRVKATQEGPFAGRVRIGSTFDYRGTLQLHVDMAHSLVRNNSAASITLSHAHPRNQRYEPISKAVLGTAGPGQSFSGTVLASDGAAVAIAVTANP